MTHGLGDEPVGAQRRTVEERANRRLLPLLLEIALAGGYAEPGDVESPRRRLPT